MRRNFVVASALAVLATVSVPGNVSADTKAVFSLSASPDEVFAAALTTLAEMNFEIQTSNEKAGLIVAEHKLVEWNHRMTVVIKKTDGGTNIQVTAKRRRFSLKGGSENERVSQLKEGLEKSLGMRVTVATGKK